MRQILTILIILFSLSYSSKAQDYSNIKKSIEFSDSLKRAKTFKKIHKALLDPKKVISLKINIGTDTIDYKKFIINIEKFINLRKVVIDNFFGYQLNLPESLWKLKKLEFVSLHNLTIEGFSDLEKLSELKYLSLMGSRLNTIPNEMYSLNNLEYLDLTLNFLNSIPEQISALTKLRELDLTNNCFTQIPPSLTKLSQLEYLDFNNAETARKFVDGTDFCFNTLTTIPDIKQMGSIKKINLYKVKINSKIEEDIENLNNKKVFVNYK